MAKIGSEEYRKRQREYMRVYFSDAEKKDAHNAKRRARRKGEDGPKIRAMQMASHYRRREAVLKKNKERYASNTQHARAIMRKSKYGVSAEQYEAMLKEQNECCAICGIEQSKLKRPLGVDHCHKTKAVRRLLCFRCNTAIGLFKENVASMRAAIAYLTGEAEPSWNSYLSPEHQSIQ